MAGSSWGVMPIAIAMLNSSASISGRPRATLMTKIEVVRTAATLTSRNENPCRPFWNAVWVWSIASPAAIVPNAVSPPVATTTPSPEPRSTTVPMNAQLGRSSGESEAGAGDAVFSATADSPVSTPSPQARSLASSSRMSGGHDAAAWGSAPRTAVTSASPRVRSRRG